MVSWSDEHLIWLRGRKGVQNLQFLYCGSGIYVDSSWIADRLLSRLSTHMAGGILCTYEILMSTTVYPHDFEYLEGIATNTNFRAR